jgi:hypothetical protein
VSVIAGRVSSDRTRESRSSSCGLSLCPSSSYCVIAGIWRITPNEAGLHPGPCMNLDKSAVPGRHVMDNPEVISPRRFSPIPSDSGAGYVGCLRADQGDTR